MEMRVGCRELQACGQQGLQRGDYVGGGEKRAIGKHHAGAKLELPISRRGVVRPLDCQGRLESSVIVEGDETIVNKRGQFFVVARESEPLFHSRGSRKHWLRTIRRAKFRHSGALGGACRGCRERKKQNGANSANQSDFVNLIIPVCKLRAQ